MSIGQKKFGQLVTELVADLQTLVRQQINLAMTELKESSRRLLRSTIFLILGLSIMMLSGMLAIIAVAYVFVALGLPVWAGFLIDAGIFSVVGILFLLLARSNATKIKAPTLAADEAQKSINQITETLARVKPESR